MSNQKGTKINQLLHEWPIGTVATSRWLRKKGIGSDLLTRYRNGNWIESIGHGAVIRKDDMVQWQGAVWALQQQLGLTIHPGGKTALTMDGKAHFVPMGRENVKLFGIRGEHHPAWFKKRDWNCDYRIFNTNLFGTDSGIGTTQRRMGSFAVRTSSAERAIMEMLYCAPQHESLEEAKLIMEGLLDLRPDLVQELLCRCSSVKVKRLFLVLAEIFEYPWLRKLDGAQVDLGSGKRSVMKGGVLHRKYEITVPRDWMTEELT